MKKRTIKLRFKLLLLAVFLACTAFSIYTQQMNISGLQAKQEALNTQYEQAEMELQRLQDQSDYMNTKDYIEDTARERFGYAYENELIIKAQDEGGN